MFDRGTITALPTDTSFGLAVRADDPEMLSELAFLKSRRPEQKLSLMCANWEMLKKFAEVPEGLPEDFFTEKPRTVILRPTPELPVSEFWPAESVAFRVATIPEVAAAIEYPVTATSANRTGEPPIFETQKLVEEFGDAVKIFPNVECGRIGVASEIWDFTQPKPIQIR